MTELKVYEPMGYLITHGNDAEHYYMPMTDIDKIMDVISKPNAPKYIDLSKYGYGREASSMIRGAKALIQTEGEVQFEIMKYPVEIREHLKIKIKNRKTEGLLTTPQTVKLIVEEYLSKTTKYFTA